MINWDYLPDRYWIQHKYLPTLSGTILYVGVEECTSFYHTLINENATFITIDINHTRACYGSPHNHIVGDILLHAGTYDNISIYGILGFCDLSNAFIDYHNHLDKLLRIGGTLMLGHHISDKYNMKYWSDFTKLTLPNYNVIEQTPRGVDTNFIWFGQKQSNVRSSV